MSIILYKLRDAIHHEACCRSTTDSNKSYDDALEDVIKDIIYYSKEFSRDMEDKNI